MHLLPFYVSARAQTSRERQHLAIFVRPSGVLCQSQPAIYLQAAPPVGKLQSADWWIRLHLVRLGWARLG